MFLKRKIRKAFKNATPNLLDQVMQEHPQQDTPLQSDIHPTVRKSGFSPALRWIAAAAAIVLVIGLAENGIGSFWGSNSLSGPSATNPSTTPTTTPTEAPWVNLSKDERYENLIAAAKNCINPSDRNHIEPTGEYFSTTCQGKPAWVVSATYKGYWYQLTFTDESLKKLDVIPTDSIKDDIYITDTAATQIAYTQVDDSLRTTNFAWFRGGLALDQDDSGTACYYVTLYRKDPAYDFSGDEYKTFRINAYTGMILGVEEFHSAQYADMISSFEIQNQLWSLVLENLDDLPGYERLDLTNWSVRIHNGDLLCQTIITYGGHEYTFETDRTGKILSIDIASTYDCRPGDVIAKGVALEIVCLARGEAFADGQTVTAHLEAGHYRIMVSNTEKPFYLVNASTGAIIQDFDLTLLDIRDIALAYRNLALEDCHRLAMDVENEGTEDECVRVSAQSGSGLYVTVVDTASGNILDSYILMASMPAWNLLSSIRPWDIGRDNALEYFGVSLQNLTELQVSLDLDTRLYTISCVANAEEYSCNVWASNCQVIPMDAIPVEDALAVMIPSLPEKVQEAHRNHGTLFGFSVDRSGEYPIYELTVLYEEINYCAKVNAITGELLEYYVKETELNPGK